MAALVVTGCGGSRSIVVGAEGQDLAAEVEQVGGQVLSEAQSIGGIVTAILNPEQREALLREGVAEILQLGAVRWRTFLPDGTALFEYKLGDVVRDNPGNVELPRNSSIIYMLDGKVSDQGAIQGPQLHPGQHERCWDHGNLVYDTIRESVLSAEIVSIPVLCDVPDREAVLLALDWILQEHPAGSRGIVNASFTFADGADIRSALERLEEAGMLVTWAAGNRSRNTCDGETPSTETIILVGAGRLGQPDERSNSGPCIDVWMDGIRQVDGMVYWGTSIAAPRVASVLANLWDSAPHMSSTDVRDLYLQVATFVDPATGQRWSSPPIKQS